MRAGESRPVRDADSQDLFGLLALCFAQYPGCFVDPHDDLPDLLRPERAFPAPGAFLVREDARGRVCACIALEAPVDGVAELHRLYVRPDVRRGGLGEALVREAEALAGAAGAGRVRLWSDLRFSAAHRLYARLGYRPLERTRALGDVSQSVEALFEKALA